MHNALGYAYFNLDSVAQAVEEYKLAVSLQACQGLGQNRVAGLGGGGGCMGEDGGSRTNCLRDWELVEGLKPLEGKSRPAGAPQPDAILQGASRHWSLPPNGRPAACAAHALCHPCPAAKWWRAAS